MDETGLALGHCKNQLVTETTNTKYSYIKSPQDREWVSIIETISAIGRRCRPICIFITGPSRIDVILMLSLLEIKAWH